MLPAKHHLHIKWPKLFVVFASFFLYWESRIQHGITKGKFNANGKPKSSLRDARGASVCRAHHGCWCSPAKYPAGVTPVLLRTIADCAPTAAELPFLEQDLLNFPTPGPPGSTYNNSQYVVQLGGTSNNEQTTPPGALAVHRGWPFFIPPSLRPYSWWYLSHTVGSLRKRNQNSQKICIWYQ